MRLPRIAFASWKNVFVPFAVGMVDRAAFMGLLDILPSVKEHLKRELE